MPTRLLHGLRTRTAASIRVGTVGIVAVTVAVGAVTGLAAVGFRWLITETTTLFSGTADFSAAAPGTHPGYEGVSWLGPWFVVLVPAVGGLIYGPLVYRYAREARGHGVPEVMLAVSRNGGRIRPRVAAVKAVASAICIGSGGSVGREGPIVQIGSALGSGIAQALHLPLHRVRTVVAAGAAAGIAATFNAPVAGVLFAMELILRSYSAGSFGLVVVAGVVGSIVSRALVGDAPFLDLPPFAVDSPWAYLVFAALGVLAGLVGVVFVRFLYATEDFCDRIWRGPEWARPAVGGLVLGVVLLVLPQMYGVGYPVLEASVAGRYAVGFLALLLVGKVVATSLTLGIGGSGGVFAPSLFIGAVLGASVGQVVHAVAPDLAPSPGAFAIVGMGAVFAGTARAPLTAVIMLVELTDQYSVVLPLMLAIVLATGTSRLLSSDTVYTLKLRRRGVVLDGHPADQILHDVPVRTVMEPAPSSVTSSTRVSSATRLLLVSGRTTLPVCDEGALVGQFRADAASEVLELDDEATEARVGDAVDDVARIPVSSTLLEALEALRRFPHDEGGAVTDGEALVGWLSHRTVLAALSAAPSADRAAGPGNRSLAAAQR
ncbi:chloride channel protein [Paraoerskovia marina]|uniref:chloride channel protein n=1 Tax=Paraoerskovia marina TaxID=545619 RepID=UPI0009DE6B69|nr:chloride channel protein [Paraoerskovia marina]